MADAPVASAASFRCVQCSATFVRQDHLHRHELSHEQLKSCVCEFCSARFHRRDILRRHYNNCKKRGDRPIPLTRSSGRRRRACDRCASHKLACDPGKPCRHCANRNQPCERSHSHIGPQPSGLSDVVGNISPEEEQRVNDAPLAMPRSGFASEPSMSVSPEPAQLAKTTSSALQPLAAPSERSVFTLDHIPVPFLTALISSDSVGFVDIFGYSSVAPEPLVEPPLPPSSQGTSSTEPGQDVFRVIEPNSNSPRSGHNVSFYQGTASPFNGLGQDSMPVSNRIPERTQFSTDSSAQNPMTRKVYELVMQLTNTFITLPKGHYAKATSMKIDQADTFFTVPNVQIFIQTYFHHFHPHFSVIHRPSFDIKTASPRLLLAVCLAGSLFMSLSRDIGHGRSLLDLAEEFIFRDAVMKSVAKGRSPNDNGGLTNDTTGGCESNLEILQAGFIIMVLQNWEGNKAAQRRARLDRLQQLVSLARASRLTAFVPTWLKTVESSQSFDWVEFGRQESCVRIMYHLFVFDNTLCIFYNYPPKLSLAEMAANLPCPEELFGATTSEECLQAAYLDELQLQKSGSLKDTFAQLIGDDVSTDIKTRLAKLTPLHLFILIHTLHYILWHSQNSSILNSTPLPLVERALSRWKSLWVWSKRPVSQRVWRRSGYIQHADEYWWLAQLKMHEKTSEDAMVFEDDHMRGIRQLLWRFCAPQVLDDLEFDI